MANKKRLIDANAFWESVSTDYWEHFTQCHTTDQIDLMEMVEENLAEQPTVEVVHGRWIYEPVEFSLVKDIRCSVCRRYVNVPENYCPDCGAKMDGDGNG